MNALNLDLRVHHYEERSLSRGSNALAIAYVEIAGEWIPGSWHGVGIHSNITTAALLAVLSAINRVFQRLDLTAQKRLLTDFCGATL
ncbi:MAG TPA: alpha-isopropylmalate synthase regulatory domain-containing protein, partial [Coleofasciculaceae cyanobacterium]